MTPEPRFCVTLLSPSSGSGVPMSHLPSRLRQSLCAAALVLILICPTLQGVAQQSPQTATPPVAPPVQWPRSHNYDVQHYRIEVSFDWAAKSVAGQTTISLRPFRSDLKEIELDAGNMQIDSVKLESGAALKFRYEDKEHLYVALDRSYPAGSELRLVVKYQAKPERGLTFIGPNADDPSRPLQIWSQGESQDNHYWFPCYDYPNDKATTELIAHVEDGYQVISNGVLVSSQPDAQSKTRAWHWKMDKPYSSYLVSIIVGKF